MVKPSSSPLTPAFFVIEDSDDAPVYPGFTRGDHWNGWECPAFTHAVAMDVIRDYNAQNAAIVAHRAIDPADLMEDAPAAFYDAERDAFVFPANPADVSYLGAEDDDVVGGTDALVERAGHLATMRLYPIGAFSWTWEAMPHVVSVEDATTARYAASYAALLPVRDQGHEATAKLVSDLVERLAHTHNRCAIHDRGALCRVTGDIDPPDHRLLEKANGWLIAAGVLDPADAL